MYNIHPTDFLIFSFDREAFQSKVLFQRPRGFSLSLHTGMLIVSGLRGGDESERSLCVSVDCGSKTCVR